MVLWLSIVLELTVSGARVVVGPGCTDRVIRARAIGPIRLGMPVDSVKARCAILRDTIELNEGEAGRALYVSVAGDTVRVDVLRDSVASLSVSSPRFATADRVHAGMSLRAFMRGRSDLEVGAGEGKIYLTERHHCGMSFGLSSEAFSWRPSVTRATLRRLPASTHVDLIFVHGMSVQGPGEPCN